MTEPTTQFQPQSATLDDWGTHELRLAAYLTTMVDPDERDHLVLEMPDPGDVPGTTPYAQFAGFGAGTRVRAELTGNHFLAEGYRLDPVRVRRLAELGWAVAGEEDEQNHHLERSVGDATEVARLVTVALRDVFHVPHPELLSVNAWGPAAAGRAVLRLSATRAVPIDIVYDVAAGASPTVVFPADRDELTAHVRAYLETRFVGELDGGQVVVDEDDDFQLRHHGGVFWVKVRQDQPAVEVMTCLVGPVRSRRQAAVEVGVLNRDHPWTRWTLHDRTVWLSVIVPSHPWVPATFEAMLGHFLAAMVSSSADLDLRLGGGADR